LSVLAIFGVGAAAGLSVDPAPVVIFGLITAVAAVLAVIGFTSTGLGTGSSSHSVAEQ